MSSQQVNQSMLQNNILLKCEKQFVSLSNSKPNVKFNSESKQEKSDAQFKYNTSQLANQNKTSSQTLLAEPDKIAHLQQSSSIINQTTNSQLHQQIIMQKEQYLAIKIDIAKEQVIKNQQSSDSSSNIMINDKEMESIIDKEIKQIEQPVKQFKRDSQHLVEIDTSRSNITQHLQLNYKPKEKQFYFIKVVPQNKTIENRETEVKIVNEKLDLIQDLKQQFTKNSEGIELDVSKLGDKELFKDLKNMKNRLQSHISINNQYLTKQRYLKKEIQDLKNKIQKVQYNYPAHQQIHFEETSQIPQPNISNLFQELLRYKHFITWSKLQQIQQIKTLNSQYLSLQTHNKQLQEFKYNFIKQVILSKSQPKQSIQIKSVEQLKYQQIKQSLLQQIAIQRRKYDKLKNTNRKSSLDLERVSDLIKQPMPLTVKVRKQDIVSRSFIIGMVFILILMIVVVYR